MPRSLVAFTCVVVTLAACSSGGGGGSRAADRSTTTSTPGASASDLAAVRVKLTPLAPLERPTALAVRKGDATLYVTEKVGRVRAYRDGALAAKPALDISERVGASGNEQGLLGLAFSPDGAHAYVDFTDRDGDTRVVEFAARTGTIDAGSARELLKVDQPQANHNGGQVAFGPDGMLYIGMGDGGAAGDGGTGHASGGNGQSLDTLLGKILRIAPSAGRTGGYSIPKGNPFASGGGRAEIWSYGLRNPWRFSFDRATGDLWIGDVGQNLWEEIDLAPKGAGAGAGDNFGWNRLEGTHTFAGAPPPGAVAPVFEYGHAATGGCSVTGGYVYRGAKIPALAGVYVYADYCVGALRGIARTGTAIGAEAPLGASTKDITSFGEDSSGELYVLSDSQGLFRVDPA